jgi:hypothetical protein
VGDKVPEGKKTKDEAPYRSREGTFFVFPPKHEGRGLEVLVEDEGQRADALPESRETTFGVTSREAMSLRAEWFPF